MFASPFSSLLFPALLLALASCSPPQEPGRHEPKDSDADTDADTDTDSDTDADTDPQFCTTFGPSRARCAVHTQDGFLASSHEGTRIVDEKVVLDPSSSRSGTDTEGVYNGGSYSQGTVTSPVFEVGLEFDALVPSWSALTPDGTWVAIEAQARVDGSWTEWYRLGAWASGENDLERHSFEGEQDAYGRVWTDTVALDSLADAARLRAHLFTTGSESPSLGRLAVALADSGAGPGEDSGGLAWGTILDVPARSQMEYEGGGVWCSPTSTSMIMAWWSEQLGYEPLEVTVPEAAEDIYDHVYEGTGNWPFNTAYASSLGWSADSGEPLHAEVGWFDSLDELEPWIASGAPLAISCAWDEGELDGAPISSTSGHLIVVRGFDEEGDVAVNDPAAASSAGVPRVYDRAQLQRAWLGGSGGVAYLFWTGYRPDL